MATKSADDKMSDAINKHHEKQNYVRDIRVYFSAPMAFVASRDAGKKFGWRCRVSEFLHKLSVIVYDPWSKRIIHGCENYGVENTHLNKILSI